MIDHAETTDILERLADVVVAWPELPVVGPSESVLVRADLITAAYAEIDRLRRDVDLLKGHNSNLIDSPKGWKS